MARQTLFAYVDGSDLSEVAETIESALETLVASTSWVLTKPKVVNQVHERDDSYRPEDLTDWELGLNLDLPDPDAEPAGWFEDVEKVARIVGQIAQRTRRGFIIGIGESDTGVSEDLFYVENDELDLERLRDVVGVGSRP